MRAVHHLSSETLALGGVQSVYEWRGDFWSRDVHCLGKTVDTPNDKKWRHAKPGANIQWTSCLELAHGHDLWIKAKTSKWHGVATRMVNFFLDKWNLDKQEVAKPRFDYVCARNSKLSAKCAS
jgi:hypothetical protein